MNKRKRSHFQSAFGPISFEPTGDAGGGVVTAPPADVITIPAPVEQPAPGLGERVQGWSEEEFLKSPAFIAALENARKQEKDKMYGRLEAAERTAKELAEARDAEVKAAAEQARKEAEEKAAAEFAEMGSKEQIAAVRAEFENRIASLQQEREVERATFEKERTFADLQNYTQNAVTAAVAAGEIAPELAHFVGGNNIDEVNASLENVKATSVTLAQQVQGLLSQAPAPAPVPQRGVAPTGYAPNGPLEAQGGIRTLSAQDIANMSMADYAKLRGSLGTARDSANRGLFG